MRVCVIMYIYIQLYTYTHSHDIWMILKLGACAARSIGTPAAPQSPTFEDLTRPNWGWFLMWLGSAAWPAKAGNCGCSYQTNIVVAGIGP